MDKQSKIAIVLATYNGEKYIKAQIDSLLAQTFQDWHLIIRDDGSNDSTVEIIRDYIARHSNKITYIEYDRMNLGTSMNFSKLVEHAQSDYIMFCDQDDVWLPRKIELTYLKMSELEKEYGRGLPLLVHGDLIVTNEDLTVISNSFWNYRKLDPKKGKTLNSALVYNVVTGCTMMINNAMRDLALPIPKEANMYDWWLALVATVFGRIDYITEPTILYRQHGRNVIGASKWDLNERLIKAAMYSEAQEFRDNLAVLITKTSDFFRLKKFKNSLSMSQNQALYFLERYYDKLNETDTRTVKAFATLASHNCLYKKILLLKYRLFEADFLRTVGLFLRV